MLAKRIAAPSLGWAGLLVLIAAVLLAAGARSAGAAEAWRVREQPGTLQYRLPETSAWLPATLGVELPPGTTVRGGSGRPAVLTQADSSIVIRGGTELTLPPQGSQTVVQRRGSVRYQVEPKAVPYFFVETPYLAIGIKGTIFEVQVDEAGTQVRVVQGLVEVTTPDGRFRAKVARGQAARIGSAAGSALETQPDASSSYAPVPQGSTGAAPSQATGSAPAEATGSAPADATSEAPAETRSEVAPEPTQPALDAALSPLTSAVRSLWSGIGGLLSQVDVVYDDRLSTRRRGPLVRTLHGVVAMGGSGDRGGSSGGGGNSGGGSSSGAGGGGGGSSGNSSSGNSSSGDSSSGSGSSGSGSSSGAGGNSGSGASRGGGGGGLGGAVGGVSSGIGGAVGGVSSGIGGAVGGVSSGIGGAVGGSLGGAVSGVGKGVGAAVGGLGRGVGGAVSGLGGNRGGGKKGRR